jgi:16S rRNA G966 N2-methylase RsmD
MRSKIRPGSFWGERVRETIAAQVEKIRHWQLIEGDYSQCVLDGPATWFIDPPYQLAGKHYRHGSSDIDFAALAAWCRTREGQVIVCENEGADWLPFEPLDAVKTTRAGRRSREVVWLFESPVALDGETVVKAAA